MKICIGLITVGLMILISNNIVLGAIIPSVEEESEYVRKRQEEWEIQRALSENLICWLSDANDVAGEECDRLVDSLLTLPEPSIKAYFVAAQATYIRGKPQKAILILEDLISKHSDKPAEVMQIPVSIVARFWIGTIARHSGDIAKAENVYETILAMLEKPDNIKGVGDKGGLLMICNLYLAEIESLHLKRNDLALARLEAIRQVKKPEGPLGGGYDIYKDWAVFEHTKISNGRSQANQQLGWSPEIIHVPILAGSQFKLCGIIQVIGYYHQEHLRSGIIGKALLDRFRNNTISRIDWSLVTLVYGISNQVEAQQAQLAQKEKLHPEAEKKYLEAEKYYSALYDDDSFFSPVAGLYLAQCKKAQSKTAEAEGILEQVRTKYQGYESHVAELKESWKKERL